MTLLAAEVPDEARQRVERAGPWLLHRGRLIARGAGGYGAEFCLHGMPIPGRPGAGCAECTEDILSLAKGQP
jgi:hypothetical protein